MKKSVLSILVLFAVSTAFAVAPDFHQWAQRPPMGWNSWDNFATAITETQTKAQADYLGIAIEGPYKSDHYRY